ncbi:hypothetical protein OIU77_029913 [Salix suchowensis]|uniref:Uncharacterized protein n=1 Tax=Salix suchowensis TaxID=1278906 RepID=A0ABQ9BA73_9ROSI|nr:hypothetical protein OIU77_029913 [Salix suchowensis]
MAGFTCLNHWSQKENGGPRLQLKMVLARVQPLVLNKLKGSLSGARLSTRGPSIVYAFHVVPLPGPTTM